MDCGAVVRLNRRAIDFAGSRVWLAGTIFRLAWTSGLNCWLTRAIDGLHCGASDGCDGTRRGDQSRTALVHVVELLAILCGFALVLILRGHGWDAGAAVGCDLGGLRAYVDAATTAVVGDAVDGGVVDDDRAVVDVGDASDIDAIHGAVVVEVISIPVAAVVTHTGVAEAVVDATIEADV